MALNDARRGSGGGQYAETGAVAKRVRELNIAAQAILRFRVWRIYNFSQSVHDAALAT